MAPTRWYRSEVQISESSTWAQSEVEVKVGDGRYDVSRPTDPALTTTWTTTTVPEAVVATARRLESVSYTPRAKTIKMWSGILVLIAVMNCTAAMQRAHNDQDGGVRGRRGGLHEGPDRGTRGPR